MDKNIIFIRKKFLNENQCKKLIQFYNTYSNLAYRYDTNSTYPLDTQEFPDITDKIKDICYNLNDSCELNTHQIVMWPSGSFMNPHFDPKNDVFACLIYLNDNYIGGETYLKRKWFFNKKIKPETGKLVIFSNSKIFHWVSKVKKGTRYTLALWFTKKNCNE